MISINRQVLFYSKYRGINTNASSISTDDEDTNSCYKLYCTLFIMICAESYKVNFVDVLIMHLMEILS